MPIQVKCACGKRFAVADTLSSKKVRCPECREAVAVPQSESSDDDLPDADGSDAGAESRKKRKRKRSGKSGSSPQKLLIWAGASLVVVALIVVGCIIGIGKMIENNKRAVEEKVRSDVQKAVANIGSQHDSAKPLLLEHRELSLPLLIDAAKDSDATRRHGALKALTGFGPGAKEIIPVFAGAVQDKDMEIQLTAIRALARFGVEAREAIPNLAKAVNDPNAKVQEAALQALDAFGADARMAVPAIADRLRAEQDQIKQTVLLERLTRLGPHAKEAAPAVAALLVKVRADLTSAQAALAAEKEKDWRLKTKRVIDKRGKVLSETTFWETKVDGPNGQPYKAYTHSYEQLELRVINLRRFDATVAKALKDIDAS